MWPEPKHGCLLLTKLKIFKSEVASFFFKLKTSFYCALNLQSTVLKADRNGHVNAHMVQIRFK